MALQSGGQMSFADVYNEITGESLPNPPISITLAELGQLQNATGQTIPLNQFSPYKPDGVLPTVFPDEWYRYCQTCGVPKPFLQINKAASSTANAGEFFNFYITVTNNGEASATGNIYIYDTIPNNIIISSVTGSNMTYTVAGQNVTITYTGGLGVGQTVGFYIIVKTFYSGTFYNQASCNGGGDNTTRYSNTTATTVATATYTSTKTERRDRTLQKNDCGSFGTGSYVQVWSPYFTNTYTSYISQADADEQATNLSVTQANNWLDANAQAVANQMGTCGYQYPTGEVIISGQSNSSRGTNFNIVVTVKTNTAPTTGTVTVNFPLPSGIIYKDVFNVPAGWFINRTDTMITMFRTATFEPGYNQGIGLILSSTATGSYNFNAVMSGGGFAANINSNNFAHTVSVPAVYSLTAIAENQDFTYGGNGLDLPLPFPGSNYAVPTDRAYYTAILDISYGSTASDQINFLAYLPSHYPGSLIKCILDTNYWQYAYSAPAGAVQITAKGSVPIGQYYFRFYIDMTIDYYLAEDSSSPSGLRVKDTFQLVDFIQNASFYLKVNNYPFQQKYTDQINFLAYLPSHYPGSLIKCILDTNYWQYAYSAPAGAVQITAKGSVPIGQYYFRFYIDMTIDYYLAEDSSSPSGLRVKDTFQLVDFIQNASFYLKVNNYPFQQKYTAIRWAANYAVELSYKFQRVPNNPNNLNLVHRSYNTSTDVQVNFNGIADTSAHFIKYIYYLDPARGTGEVMPSYGGNYYLYYINSGFPNYQNLQYFVIQIKTDLYQNGQEIRQAVSKTGYFEYTVQSLVPNPKLLYGEMLIYVNSDGSYDYGNV